MGERESRPKLIKRLKALWKDEYTKSIYLKKVSILNGQSLRGIKNSSICFQFPVSVITGVNGSGKSTFLALSVLGFHAEEPPLTFSRRLEFLKFNHFFLSTAKDKHKAGILLQWEYTGERAELTEKGSERWMRYIRNSGEPRRPKKGTEFIGISRITPAFEKKGYDRYFSGKHKLEEREQDDSLLEKISRIMSKPYSAVSEIVYKNTSGIHAVHSYNATHTSFNAGAGEECLSYILGVLLNCPKGSFVAIEEIEIGLHPSILSNLVDVILEIAVEKKLQIVITSHSPEFLRACPKEALILAERGEGTINFYNQPYVEYAISRIGGGVDPEIYIVCEDKIGAWLIESALPNRIRQVCRICGFGGKDELMRKAEVVKKIHPGKKVFIIWDGDVSADKLRKAREQGFSACQLPGGSSPEEYIFSKLQTSEGKEYLKGRYKLGEEEAMAKLRSLQAIVDCHDLPYELAKGICGQNDIGNSDSVTMDLIRFVTEKFEEDFAGLIETIRSTLDDVTALPASYTPTTTI